MSSSHFVRWQRWWCVASSVEATKRVTVVDGGDQVVLVEVGWAAQAWSGSWCDEVLRYFGLVLV